MRSLIVLLLLLTTSFSTCGLPAEQTGASKPTGGNADFVQTFELTVDGSKKTYTPEDVLSMSYVDNKYLGLSLMSEKNDIQFSISAWLPGLEPGTYGVYDCREPSDCEQGMDDKKQSALYGPYPKNPIPPLSSSRIAYNAAPLGLEPLTFIITSITDEQQAGVPWKTKRVKGHFYGTLAYVEKQEQDWHVIGETTKIEGQFDMYCTIR